MERRAGTGRLPDDFSGPLDRLRCSSTESGPTDFRDVAEVLLRRAVVHAFGRTCRLREIEFYLHSASHPDPFTHCHEGQAHFCRWYLHRVGTGFKSGSFKGIDLAVGGDGVLGGILIRSIELDDGRVVNGSSLVVDALLSFAEVETVPALHEAITCRGACDPDNPLRLEHADERDVDVHSSARVGLSLKAQHSQGPPLEFILRRYRFLVGPREIKKGRPHLVLALLRDGVSEDEIHEMTGTPLKSIREYATWADRGAGEATDFRTYSPIRARDLCNLSFELER